MRSLAATAVLLLAPALALAGDPLPEGSAPADASPAPAAPGPAAADGERGDVPPAQPQVIPTPALVEKLARGDRLALAGDHRNALFAYQDAVYMQPDYAPAHVKLGRAYLALRHPARAIAQAEAALAADPTSAEARELLQDARAASAPKDIPGGTDGRLIFRLAPGNDDLPPPRESPAEGTRPGPPPAR